MNMQPQGNTQTGRAEMTLEFEGEMTKPGRIYEAMANVMKEISPIAKDKKMDSGSIRYKFRGIDDVYNKLQPLLAREGIFIVPYMVERMQQAMSDRLIKVFCRMRYYFYCADGSYIASEVVGESNDTSDKGTNKCMSIAIKYVLFQMFCIPTEDMSDPDSVMIENGSGREAAREAAQENGSRSGKAQAKRQDFLKFLNGVFGGKYKQAYSDISQFLGRNVYSVDDLSEKEMCMYQEAVMDEN